jgi:hypothetical protein
MVHIARCEFADPEDVAEVVGLPAVEQFIDESRDMKCMCRSGPLTNSV